jgi:Fe-S cluster assembly ATPase SufC
VLLTILEIPQKQLNTEKNKLCDTNIELEKKLAALKLKNDSLKEALQNAPVNLGFSGTLKTRDEQIKHSLFKDSLNLSEAGGRADRKRQYNWDIFRGVIESVLNRL